MRRLALTLALALVPALHAQTPNAGPGAPPGAPRGPGMGRGPRGGIGPGVGPAMAPMGPMDDAASFLLAHTAELKLSDSQVTRLAAIARRTADRRQAAMRSMDSVMTRGPQPGDSARRGRMTPPPQVRAMMDRMREQHHADLREALGILTPDQQATGWEIVSMRGGPGRRGGRGS
jgi:hypothetical protein